MSNHIIEPERHGLWIAAAFIVALMGVSVGVVSMIRVHQLAMMNGIQVLALNKRIVGLENKIAALTPAAPAPAAAAPAADAAPAPEAAPAP